MFIYCYLAINTYVFTYFFLVILYVVCVPISLWNYKPPAGQGLLPLTSPGLSKTQTKAKNQGKEKSARRNAAT